MSDYQKELKETWNTKRKENLIPEAMIDYLNNLVKENKEWELAMQETLKRRQK